MTDISFRLFDPDEPSGAGDLSDPAPGAAGVHLPEVETDAYTTPEPILMVEYIDPRNVELELIRASWGPLRELKLKGPIVIVITANLHDSCEARERELYRTWTSSRTSGNVTSKAVVDKDGQQFILVDARLVLREQFDDGEMRALPEALAHSECNLERLLEHEGHHLAVRARGEGADVTFCSCQLEGDRAEDQFRMMAALALEEFRVEREQCAAGRFLDKNISATLPTELQRYRTAFIQGFTTGGGAVHAARALNDLGTELAAVATAHLCGDTLDDRLYGETRWQQIVGPNWDTLVRALEQVPSALTKVDAIELETAIDALAACLRGWFERLGFTLEDDPRGGHLFSADPAASSLAPPTDS